MINKDEMLKLATDLEALADQDLSDISAETLYEQLKKEASLTVEDDKILEAVVSCIDSMGRHSL